MMLAAVRLRGRGRDRKERCRVRNEDRRGGEIWRFERRGKERRGKKEIKKKKKRAKKDSKKDEDGGWTGESERTSQHRTEGQKGKAGDKAGSSRRREGN